MYRARDRVELLTGTLTAVSFAIVGAVVLDTVPSSLFPAAPARVMGSIPHVLGAVSAVAIGTIVAGVRSIRTGRVQRHRRLMLITFGLFGVFLTIDLYRLVVVGPTTFSGPAVVETLVYLPLLVGHAVLALATFPAVYYALLVGLTNSVEDLRETDHARLGRLAAALWLLSLASGVAIYAMLHLVW